MMKLFPAFGAALLASLVLSGLVAGSALALSYSPANGTFPQNYAIGGGTGAVMEVAGKPSLKVQCSQAGGGTTSFNSGTSGTARLEFKSCKASSIGVTCTTAGQPAGTIITKVLGVTPVYLNAEQTKYGLRLSGEGSGPNWWEPGTFATFACGGGSMRTQTGFETVEITNPLNVNTESFSVVANEATQKAGGSYVLGESGAAVALRTSFTMWSVSGVLAKFVP